MKILRHKTVKQEVTAGYRCDVCEREADPVTFDREWFGFNHLHHAWGNDSIDSVERFHVCSPECFVVQLARSVEDLDGYEGAEVADMPLAFAAKLVAMIRSVPKGQS